MDVNSVSKALSAIQMIGASSEATACSLRESVSVVIAALIEWDGDDAFTERNGWSERRATGNLGRVYFIRQGKMFLRYDHLVDSSAVEFPGKTHLSEIYAFAVAVSEGMMGDIDFERPGEYLMG